MFGFLLVLISVVALLLILIILLQSGKGGGLAAEFGGASSSTDSFIGGRQAANLLTRLSWIGGGVFMFVALVLSVLSTHTVGAPESILRGEFGAQVPEAPTSVLEAEGTDATPDDAAGEAGEADPGPGQSPPAGDPPSQPGGGN